MHTLILRSVPVKLFKDIDKMNELAVIMTATIIKTMFKMNLRVFGVELLFTYCVYTVYMDKVVDEVLESEAELD